MLTRLSASLYKIKWMWRQIQYCLQHMKLRVSSPIGLHAESGKRRDTPPPGAAATVTQGDNTDLEPCPLPPA